MWRRAWAVGVALAALVLLCGGVARGHEVGVSIEGDKVETKYVQVQVRAPFDSTPLVIEAAEYFHDESDDLFWQFVEELGAVATPGGSDRDVYKAVMAQAAGILGKLNVEVLRMELGMRAYAPRVEMYRQHALDVLFEMEKRGALPDEGLPPCWALVSGRVATSVEELREIFDDPFRGHMRYVLSFDDEHHVLDHVFRPTRAEDSTDTVHKVYLYCPVGTRRFMDFHAAITELVQRGVARYTHRHYLPPRNQTAVDLLANTCTAREDEHEHWLLAPEPQGLAVAGYGAELVLQSGDYASHIDDQPLYALSEDEMVVGQERMNVWEHWDQDVAGFRFSTLLSRKPHLAEKLYAFKEHLVSQTEVSEHMEVWEYATVGLQAAQRVATSDNPLRLLATVNHDLPTQAAALQRISIDAEFRDELKYNQGILTPGVNQLLINGRHIDVGNTDAFTLLEAVREEVRLLDALRRLELPSFTAMKLAAKSLTSGVTRVDVRSGLVQFMNDLEEDQRYAWWPDDVSKLTKKIRGIPFLRRNLYTLVLFADVSTPEGIRAIATLVRNHKKNAPVRMGVVLITDSSSSSAAHTPTAGGGEPGEGTELDANSAQCAPTGVLWSHTDVDALREDEAEEGSDEDPHGKRLGEMVVRAFMHLKQRASADVAFAFIEHVASALFPPGRVVSAVDLSHKVVKNMYEHVVHHHNSKKEVDDFDVAGRATQYDQMIFQSNQLMRQKGIVETPVFFVNGQMYPKEKLRTPMEFISTCTDQIPHLVELIGRGAITPTSSVYDVVLDHKDVLPRYHASMLAADGSDTTRFVATHDDDKHVHSAPLVYTMHEDSDTNKVDWEKWHGWWHELSAEDKTRNVKSRIKYFAAAPVDATAGGGGDQKPVHKQPVRLLSHWVVADLSSAHGLRMAAEVLQRVLADGSLSRVAFVHNPAFDPAGIASFSAASPYTLPLPIPRLLATVLHRHGVEEAYALVRRLLLCSYAHLRDVGAFDGRRTVSYRTGADAHTNYYDVVTNLLHEFNLFSIDTVRDLTEPDELAEVYKQLKTERAWAQEVLGLEPGASALITNGRVYAVQPAQPFTASDISMIERLELRRLHALREDLKVGLMAGIPRTAEQRADMALAVVSLLTASERRGGRRTSLPLNLRTRHTMVTVERRLNLLSETHLEVWAALDPLSPDVAHVAPLLELMAKRFPVRIRLFLNPALEQNEHVFKRFYRYAAQGEVRFDAAGCLQPMLGALFAQLPEKRTYSLQVDAPRAWNVVPESADYDMDNLRLGEKHREATVRADYRMESVTLTGTVPNLRTLSEHPLSLELVLGSARQMHVDDTVAMGHDAYFQLQARPGVWRLRPNDQRFTFAPRSAAAQLAAPAVGDVTSGRGRSRVVVVPDRKYIEVVVDSFRSDPVLLEARKLDMSPPPMVIRPRTEPADTVHVFSIASGHMYERLLAVMIVSAVEQTEAPVKFWFVANFLSPRFKGELPLLASRVGFTYELVTYKWPAHLRAQSERKRMIWGYKILFLDVLFPLNLNRIIFIDADQVVRSDLSELWRVDMRGKPLAYVPFCDSRPEMKSFRFWDRGFWRSHLRGRPYHISALFVVDLHVLRRIGAGDRLRELYQQLSRDPNNLANLDQDLPNYAQHVVPIHSLPSEWLWCETWCSEESKARAKTIDLCSNPKTQESKLDMAPRVFSNWGELQAVVADVEATYEYMRNNNHLEYYEVSRAVLKNWLHLWSEFV